MRVPYQNLVLRLCLVLFVLKLVLVLTHSATGTPKIAEQGHIAITWTAYIADDRSTLPECSPDSKVLMYPTNANLF